MVNYRLATPQDAAAIAALHTESWRQNYRGIWSDAYLDTDVFRDRAAVWQARLTQPAAAQYVVVAEQDGQLVGFVCAFFAESPVFGTLIDNLHVAPATKGRGVGTELMKWVARQADLREPDAKFYLWVLEQNHPARIFYDHLGATNHETVWNADPDGQSSPKCRCSWASAQAFLAQSADHPHRNCQ